MLGPRPRGWSESYGLLRALVTAYLFPDWESLPAIYTAHVPTYVLRSPTDPYGTAYRQFLAQDITVRLRTIGAVAPGAEKAVNDRGVNAALGLYSRTYGAGARHTFGQYFAMKAVDHVLAYLQEAYPVPRIEELVTRLKLATAAHETKESARGGEEPNGRGTQLEGDKRDDPSAQPGDSTVQKPRALVRPLMA